MLLKLKKIKAFSLTEMMVVVAIVSILAIIVVPEYKAHIVRAKATSLNNVLANFQNEAITRFITKGSWPGSMTIPSILYGENGDFDSGSGYLTWIGCTLQANGRDGIFFNGIFSADDLGLPPNPNNLANSFYGGTYFIRSAAFIDEDGIVRTYCGGWNIGDGNDLPAEYMPSTCRYTRMDFASSCQIPPF